MAPFPPTASLARRAVNARIAAEAQEQRGVIARKQLVALGWSEATIDRRIGDGLLRPMWPGVYAHGHSVLGRDGWLMAAALACGNGSALCARAAAAVRGHLNAWSTIDVAPAKRRGTDLDGIRVHRLELAPEEVETHRGLPVTTVARTALDVAAAEGADRAGELLDRALLDGHYDHAEMLALLEARKGARGMAGLRDAVEGLGDEGVRFRSRPERRARDLLRGTDLPQPRVNAWFPTRAGHGHELDLWYPDLRLDLEIDGPHHRLPHQRRKDALRDADLRSFGVTVLRVTDTAVLDDPERFLLAVRDAVERQMTLTAWRVN